MKNKRNGFSLIELICIIVIVGLVITMTILGISRMREQSKIDSKLAQEETINSACESYINKNRNIAPKAVGESVNVTFEELKENNYLTEDIKNSKNESCMTNSYVRVYKLNQKEYSYLPYLYCGEEEKDEVEKIPSPTVNILFIDDKDENSNNLIFNDIYTSRIYIEMNGGEDVFGRQLELYNYEINIYMSTKTNPVLTKAYSSGVISANKRTTYTIEQKIINYINAKDATSISVVVKTTNILGAVSEATSTAQANNNGN